MSRLQRTAWRNRYGPWAIVTGASRGIGHALALDLASRGLNVILAARDDTELNELATVIHERHQVDVDVVIEDLATDAGTDALISAADCRDVGLFVGNAGIGSSGPFADSDINNELTMIDLNVRSLARQTFYFANRFRRRGSGGLILLSSIVCWQGVPRATNYAATKAYVQSFAEGLSRELRKDGVDVLASAPAPVDTAFLARADMRANGVSPTVVARNTLNALGRKTTVYPHIKSRFLSAALALLPRFARVRVLETVMQGMTAHQQNT
ncbi:MAG: SDR family NAD(P)-dependent oxidoreductase [Pseudomonadota bacterium]